MTTNHIDQLTEWWANAEQVDSGTVVGEGDHIITRKHPSPHYPDAVSYVTNLLGKGEDCAITAPYTRILARAPKPKPAWHDAVAVIAATEDDGIRRAFVPQYDTETGEDRVDTWADWQGAYGTDDLIDPTPLIEAKVTDEMVMSAMAFWDETTEPGNYDSEDLKWAAAFIAAALGLEDE